MLESRACVYVKHGQRNTDIMLYVALFNGSNCVVTDPVRILLLILITYVCAAVIYKRFELNLCF